MKRIILTLCFFVTFLNFAYSEEYYNCVDRDGNTVLTTTPQDGMKCALKESYEKPSPEEPTNAKGKDIVKEKEIPKASRTRINNCFNCCYNKILACYNYTADSRRCLTEKQNCDATCNSEGASPSSWSDCWSKSDK